MLGDGTVHQKIRTVGNELPLHEIVMKRLSGPVATLRPVADPGNLQHPQQRHEFMLN